MFVAACSSEPKEGDLTYETLDECIQDNKATAHACSTAFDQAYRIHVQQSPRYTDQGSCSQVYGNCTVYVENGHSFWMPFMSGFLAGHWTAQYGAARRPFIETYGDYAYRPLYRNDDDRNRGTWSSSYGGGGYSSGSYRTYSGRSWGSGGSSWGGGGGSSSRGGISTSSVSRGGFGGSSSARGSWGGG